MATTERLARRIVGGAMIVAGAGLTYNIFVDPANRLGGDALRHGLVNILGPFLLTVGLLVGWPAVRANYRALIWAGTSLFLLLGLLYLYELTSESEVARFLVSVALVVIGLPALTLVGFGLWKRSRQAARLGR